MTVADGRSLELDGRAAHARADYPTAVVRYEDAFAAYRQAGDLTAAARAARTVGWFRGWVYGDWAVHRGWIARARRILEQSASEQARGWVTLDDALSGHDFDVQRAQYLEAIAVARRTDDRDLECDATASLGMMLVFSGHVDDGMGHLDEALAAICGGEVSELPVVEGCLCGLITACERVRDVDRADQWLRAAQQVMQRGNLLAVAGHCRAHYAGILVAAGRWSDAEDELVGALDLLPEGVASWQEARCRLADLRVQQGRYEDADALLAGLDHRAESVGPQVALHLAGGRADLALERLDRALGADPDLSMLTALLALQVDAHLAGASAATAAGADLAAARRASDRLQAIATDHPSGWAVGLAAVARARICVAAGDGDARACWHEALARFESARMPAEVALVRLELGRLLAPERPAVAIVELTAAHDGFEQLGARRRADEAAALLRTLGGPAKPGPKRGGTGLTRREDEVLALMAHGLTNGEIGDRLFISAKTAEHHVGRILSKLGLRSRAEAAAYATRHHPGGDEFGAPPSSNRS